MGPDQGVREVNRQLKEAFAASGASGRLKDRDRESGTWYPSWHAVPAPGQRFASPFEDNPGGFRVMGAITVNSP